MKKKHIVIALIVLAASSCLIMKQYRKYVEDQQVDRSSVISFQDPLFFQNYKRGKYPSITEVTENEAKKVKGLQIYSDEKVGFSYSLEDLRHFPNLTALEISGIDNEMIKEISEYENLNYVSITVVEQEIDLSPLKKMENLKCLGLGRVAHPGVFEVIMDMPQLETVEIKSSEIVNLEFLKGLPNLKRLNISDGSIVDISAIGELKQLKYLYMENTDIEKMDGLQAIGNLKQLEQLLLRDLAVENIEFVKSLSKLEWLSLIRVGTTDIQTLGNLEHYPQMGAFYYSDDIKDANAKQCQEIEKVLGERGLEISPEFRDDERMNTPYDLE